MRLTGALVVFEPASIKDEVQFKKAIQQAHIVKYANDRIDSVDEFVSSSPVLLIETLGGDGLKFKYIKEEQRKGEWVMLPAFKVEVFRDAAGSGDWCTAGLMHRLGQYGGSRFFDYNDGDIAAALQYGQALSALNCSFIGARGGMYVLEREVLEEYAYTILEQNVSPEDFSAPDSDDIRNVIRAFCPSCGDEALETMK
ncbi:MAG: hypothetical protein BWY76_01452 [bacterium ADurb.Bin429]|nr:MAG: hypothetical protein BWY76_01452 [bacterium ADurb.Bin429]